MMIKSICSSSNHIYLLKSMILVFLLVIFISTSQSQEVNLILAVDTSGSTSMGNYLPSVSDGIKIFLNEMDKKAPLVNIGIVSWDDNIDFINTNEYNKSKLVSMLSSIENEGTDITQAMIRSEIIIDNLETINKIDSCYCKNIIIIITSQSEYSRLNDSLYKGINPIHFVYITNNMNSFLNDGYYIYLKNLAQQYSGTLHTIPTDSEAIANGLWDIAFDAFIDIAREQESISKKMPIINNSVINKLITNRTNTKKLCISNIIIYDNLSLNIVGSDNELVFYNCIFREPLEIEDSNIKNTIEFYRCIFVKPVTISNSSFKEPIEFNNCNFQEGAFLNISNSYFNSSVDFRGSSFGSRFDIRNSIFNDNCSFQQSKFNSVSGFKNLIFKNNTLFTSSIFADKTNFYLLKFYKEADFRKMTFVGTTSFNRTEFFGPASFENSYFNDVSFLFSKFNDVANFRQGNFNKNASFMGTIFLKSVIFSSSKFMDIACFGLASFNESADFRYSTFKGTLELTKVKINHLESFYWPYFINKIICEDQITFSELIRNFRNLRNFEVADEMYFQYCEMKKNQYGWFELPKWKYILAYYTCGYGVKPLYTIYLGVFIILIFGLFFALSIYIIDGMKFSYELNECIWFSSILLLSIPKELYPKSEKNYDNILKKIKSNKFIKYFPIIERLTGWALMLLLINTLTRVIISY